MLMSVHMAETHGGCSCESSALIPPIYSPRTSDGGRSRVMMVEDGGYLSCGVDCTGSIERCVD